jgi:sugar lactone lactonase YvrE
VDPDGAATRVADGVHFPNGLVMTPGGTLVVAETLGQRLTAFDVGEDGTLGRPRPWATFASEPAAGFPEAIASGAITPDGIWLDAGRTLFLCAGPTIGDGDPRTEHRGVILATRVDYGTS